MFQSSGFLGILTGNNLLRIEILKEENVLLKQIFTVLIDMIFEEISGFVN